MDIERLLVFAAQSRLEQGFGYLRADGTVDSSRGLETWINARMTHVFGLASLSGSASWRSLAEHGLAALVGPLRDHEHDGWFARDSGVQDKLAYEHAFVMLAAATATAAGLAGARDVLDDALRIWFSQFWDESAGAAVDQWDRSWTVLGDYRGANANMHGVEAMLAAADAVASEVVADRLRAGAMRAVDRFVRQGAASREWRLPEHFGPDWVALPEHNAARPADPFHPYGVTVGHQFEWARLMLHLRASLGVETAPGWLLADARKLYAVAKNRGWQADGQAGFVYTLDWNDRPVVAARMHWVLAEAVSCAAVLYNVTGEQEFADDLEAWMAYAHRFFADPSSGSWHHELTAKGDVATDTWAGQPDAYHVFQALLLPGLPVVGSVAAAVLARLDCWP